MDALVSVISPVFNHEKFIAECIQSVLNQNYENWEMLVINDGSTDRTAEIAKEFAAIDPRIQVFNRQNIGIFRLSENYNFALHHAKGRYIAILEGDDTWEPEKLRHQVSILERNQALVMSWSSANQVNIDKTQLFYISPALGPSDVGLFSNNPVGSILDILFLRNCIPALTVLIRKDALEKIGGFKQGYGLPLVDLPTWQELSTLGPFYYDEKPTGNWRVYPNQTTKTHLVRIFSGCYSLSLANFKSFSLDSTLHFNISREDIDKHFKAMMIIAYAREGRYLLIKKKYEEARKNYFRAIFSRGGQYTWKLRALVGLLFSLVHWDVEGLARLMKHQSYKN